jgi:hypothetical protein
VTGTENCDRSGVHEHAVFSVNEQERGCALRIDLVPLSAAQNTRPWKAIEPQTLESRSALVRSRIRAKNY